jgi:hypothetical protein
MTSSAIHKESDPPTTTAAIIHSFVQATFCLRSSTDPIFCLIAAVLQTAVTLQGKSNCEIYCNARHHPPFPI